MVYDFFLSSNEREEWVKTKFKRARARGAIGYSLKWGKPGPSVRRAKVHIRAPFGPISRLEPESRKTINFI